MKAKIFYNNLAFRLAAPILFGMVIYVLVLMFFDSVDMLINNFFSREVLFVIGLTYIFFELNRLIVIAMTRLFATKDKIILWFLLEYLVAFLLTASVLSILLYLYFVNIEGFSTIGTELITFNAIYLFAAVFYHLYYYSMYFLYKRNDELIRTEKINRDNLELELSTYKSQINPEFLFQTLEIILEELRKDKKRTDELIDNLAKVYRYTLDNQQNDLIELRDELQSLQPVLLIFQAKFPEAVIIQQDIVQDDGFYLVPGTLQTLFEHAVIKNLISDKTPMTFQLEKKDDYLLIGYMLNEKITNTNGNEFRIEHLKKTYNHLTEREFKLFTKSRKQHIEIPLLKVEEE